VHKTNVLTHAGSLWLRTVDAVKPDFPDVQVDYAHVRRGLPLLRHPAASGSTSS